MVHRVKIRISMILLPLLASGVLAQDATLIEEQPDPRRYTVEMIIFSYEQNVSVGSEVFVADEPPPIDLGGDGDLIEEIEPIDTIAPSLEEMEERGSRKFEIVMLPEDDFALLDVFDRLDRLDAYQPLMHFGWTQAMYPDEETEARPLSSFLTPPAGLDGDLTLYLSRYLHLAVNLQLDAPTPEATEATRDLGSFSDSYSDSFTDFSDNTALVYPVRYRIEEDRIFRNGELRYYDHPKFGVLAKITRVEEGESEKFEEELLGYDGE
jgi:hypothetical protein